MFPVWFPTQFPVELPYRGHCYQGDFLHVFKLLPGITQPVLQQHLYVHAHFSFCGMPFQVAPHPKHSFGLVITVHITHPVAVSIASKESELMATKHPEDKLSYSEAFTTHGALEEAIKGVSILQARTPSKHIFRYLPGISLPVLQHHLAQAVIFCGPTLPYIVDCDLHYPGMFVVTVCPGHPVATNCELLVEALCDIFQRQADFDAFHNPSPVLWYPVVPPPCAPPKAATSRKQPRAATNDRLQPAPKATPKDISMPNHKTACHNASPQVTSTASAQATPRTATPPFLSNAGRPRKGPKTRLAEEMAAEDAAKVVAKAALVELPAVTKPRLTHKAR